jgi:tetratricopeptide (TPR) repeat protein
MEEELTRFPGAEIPSMIACRSEPPRLPSLLRAVMLILFCAPCGLLHAAMTAAESRRVLDDGIDHFYNLEYDQALASFERLRDDDPRNAAWQNHVALGYFYKELFLGGVLEGDLFGASNKFFKTKKFPTVAALENGFREANQRAVELCEATLKRSPRDTDALYACGVAYAARSTHQGLIERSALDFLGNARRADDFHSRLIRIEPRRYDGYLIPGVVDFVLGSLPGPVKVLFFFAGLTGDKQRGLKLVETTAQWGSSSKSDAQILLTVMYRREKRFADARAALEKLAASYPRNYIFPLEIASIYRAADQLPESIRQYERVLEQVHTGTPNFPQAPVARIHFELGELYRRAGNLDAARGHLRQVERSKGSTPELDQESAWILSQIDAAQQDHAAPK